MIMMIIITIIPLIVTSSVVVAIRKPDLNAAKAYPGPFGINLKNTHHCACYHSATARKERRSRNGQCTNQESGISVL